METHRVAQLIIYFNLSTILIYSTAVLSSGLKFYFVVIGLKICKIFMTLAIQKNLHGKNSVLVFDIYVKSA